ncbi:putative pyridoxine 5'-phosphate oxidase superfamily flavin-nucleotide-binding protein [Catenuloplanes nepalensis]|uniref:Pyridoxine 5'-phosphate oxidase superfamily flavin-nucleotide-binding protein n=1 Tax=Catenuloplanes nepalensis TaxID=587533 RepID=A0ABT9MX27_9ACTN|nr:pyridoxamine 5'-phosphate oxidase family protein [Catenuloplanes nepalensis]MDP9795798.1 putative pyridoxine 5'-phosphate oxidase superfamily flavin-nucleotide-binding protein [Catenuloplanes nepalensis]
MIDFPTGRAAGGAHAGERAVQERAHEGGPEWGSPMFGPEIPLGFVPFLRAQHMLIAGAADDDGAVWSTVLTGRPGFIQPADERTIVVDALPAPGDPLHGAFRTYRDVGLLALHPQTRRRIRVNGVARQDGQRLIVRTEQVLGNCPKYLQTRTITGSDDATPAGAPAAGTALTDGQRRWIETADTFFIASRSPEHGADSSHRGGTPGFVTVTGPRTLRWPDYTGNQFYMTLGNLHLDPASGLLFLDWEHGHTLQLTGAARIDWAPESAAAYPGALRVVEFDVASVVQRDHASPLRWQLQEYSRVNPPVAGRS